MMSYDNYHNTTKVTADPDPVRMSVGQAACCTACARCALLPRVGGIITVSKKIYWPSTAAFQLSSMR